jgi:hypothetical protein
MMLCMPLNWGSAASWSVQEVIGVVGGKGVPLASGRVRGNARVQMVSNGYTREVWWVVGAGAARGALIGPGHASTASCNTATTHGPSDPSAALARLFDTLMKIGCH